MSAPGLPFPARHPNTISVTNWTSGALHRGRVWTIMALPRAWETGCGPVSALVPAVSDLLAVQRAELSIELYRARFVAGLRSHDLRPGKLQGYLEADRRWIAVEPGDTLCCACSRAAAAADGCHRVWAARALADAGWHVLLDGQPLRAA